MDPSDSEILSRIGDLVERENELRGRHRQSPLTGDELRTLEGLEVELDQCWDLLNQRRARREFAMNPDEASVRHEGTVEDYEQGDQKPSGFPEVFHLDQPPTFEDAGEYVAGEPRPRIRRVSVILFNVTNASNDPTKATLPFIGAVSGIENGDQPQIMLLGEAAYLANEEVSAAVHGIGLPPLRDLWARVTEHEIPVHVGAPCAGARAVSNDDLAWINGRLIGGTEWAKLIAAADQVVTIGCQLK